MKKQLLILTILFISITTHSQSVGDTFVDSFITYEITSLSPNRVRVIDYNTTGGTDVVIPNSVTPNASGRASESGNANDRMATYTVTSIGNSAFQSKGLTSVFIPPNVTSIGNGAFGANNLADVTIPDSVISIGNLAFISNDITSLILGAGLTSIGGNAFDSNFLLTCVRSDATTAPSIFTGNGDTFGAANRPNIDLFIPTGTSNSYNAAGWTGFNTFNDGFDVNSQFTVDNIRYRVTSIVNSTVSVRGYNPSGAGGTVIDIPSTVSGCVSQTFTVTAIDDFAFGNEPISSVTIPNTILNIGQYAFNNCNLTSVTIPASVNTVGQQAFQSNSISTLNISNGLTAIEDYAFSGNQLTDITIPGSVTSIGNGAFRVNPLATVTSLATTPPSITTVAGPNDTFDIGGNRSNIDLFIPSGTLGAYVTDPGALWTGFNSVTEQLVVGDPLVDNYISYEVTSTALNTVTVTGWDTAGGTVVNIPTSVQNGTITYDVTQIADNAFENKGLTDVTIPNTVTSIGISAFSTNNLTDVVIPNSITAIGSLAFASNLLTDVYSEAMTPPTIVTDASNANRVLNGTDTFAADRSTIHLHIPPGTSGAYVTDAGALWTGFNPVTEDALLSTNDFELDNNIKVITTTDEIKVIASNAIRLQNYSLYSIAGAKVSEGKESNISTSTFASGIYILKLFFDKGSVVKKFAK